MKSSIKKIILILIIIAIIVAVGLFIGSFVKDKSDNKKAMKVVKKDYKVFTDQAVEFNNYRDKIYEEVFSDSYYDSFKDNYENFEKQFNDYEKLVDKITKKSKNLIKNCDGIYYTSVEVNTMCSNFGKDYESIINSFVVDVGNYNTLIKEYNKYIDENKLDSSKLSKYKSDKKYVDYNKDKKYSGKE